MWGSVMGYCFAEFSLMLTLMTLLLLRRTLLVTQIRRRWWWWYAQREQLIGWATYWKWTSWWLVDDNLESLVLNVGCDDTDEKNIFDVSVEKEHSLVGPIVPRLTHATQVHCCLQFKVKEILHIWHYKRVCLQHERSEGSRQAVLVDPLVRHLSP